MFTYNATIGSNSDGVSNRIILNDTKKHRRDTRTRTQCGIILLFVCLCLQDAMHLSSLLINYSNNERGTKENDH
jgi:hypothetical protein